MITDRHINPEIRVDDQSRKAVRFLTRVRSRAEFASDGRDGAEIPLISRGSLISNGSPVLS